MHYRPSGCLVRKGPAGRHRTAPIRCRPRGLSQGNLRQVPVILALGSYASPRAMFARPRDLLAVALLESSHFPQRYGLGSPPDALVCLLAEERRRAQSSQW